MLWTLHNRASEARKQHGVLGDPKCLEIYAALEYDYERSFGPAGPSHAVRSKLFDQRIVRFFDEHPDGVAVQLGEGLETQRYRIELPQAATWISVDVPEAIAIREQFIAPGERHLHIPVSALDPAWIERVPPGRPVLITAQGLFMYFEPEPLAELLRAISLALPGADLSFDHIPEWFSKKSTSEKGLQKTEHYRLPPMPWGVAPSAVPDVLRSWGLDFDAAAGAPFPFLGDRGPGRMLHAGLRRLPGLKEQLFAITHVRGLRLA